MSTAQAVSAAPAGRGQLQGSCTKTAPPSWRGFVNMFGWLGVPMLLAFVLSTVWTAMLAAIQIAPNAIANTLMGTSDFDFGEFWLLSRPDKPVNLSAIVALFVFAAGYAYLALAMIFPHSLVGQATPFRSPTKSAIHAPTRDKLVPVASAKRVLSRQIGVRLAGLGRWLDANKDISGRCEPTNY
jgi:hypothetical protein